MSDLDQFVASAEADFAAATEPAKLEDAKARYLGKDGSLTTLLKGLGKLPRKSAKPRVPPSTRPRAASSRR
jgi:phenylalanyl-tRNA synthetase alpha chain